VEGYTMPAAKAADGAYHVTNAEAHAWTEVYFEGYGWRSFEPTASYQRLRGMDAPQDGEGALAAGAGDEGEGDEPPPDEGEGDGEAAEPEGAEAGGPEAGQEEAAGAGGEGGAQPGFLARHPGLKLALAALGCLAAALALLLCVGEARRRLRRARFRAAPDKAVRGMFAHYFRILRRLKCSVAPGETLSQFAERAAGALQLSGPRLADATEVLVRLCYSGRGATEEDRRRVQALYPALLELYERRRGWVRSRIARDVLAII